MIRAILTDIEGTTSSLSFVKDVLFPYSRARLRAFVMQRQNAPDVRPLLEETAAACGTSLSTDDMIECLIRWIDEDRKAPSLKALQGLIWADGYAQGDFLGHIYEDAARKLLEWHRAGLLLFVYSSGSVHAQKLLFGHTEYGDLTGLFTGNFDTRVGPKQESESYGRILDSIGFAAADVLFLSDMEAELDAASHGGMQTFKLERDGPSAQESAHPVANSFDGINFD